MQRIISQRVPNNFTTKVSFNFSTLFFSFLLILTVYLPFEDFVLKFFLVSDKTYILLRQISDFSVFNMYMLFVFVVLYRGKLRVPGKILSIIFVIFLSYIILENTFMARVDLTTISSIKALVRYIPLVFIVYHLRPSDQFKVEFIKLVIALAFVEAIIGYVEIIGGNTIVSFFAPRLIDNPELGIVFTSTLAVINNTGEIFGTMPYTINYSLFLVIGTVLWIHFAKYLYKIKSSLIFFLGVIFLIVPIYFSGSRVGFFAAILAILLSVGMKYGVRAFFLGLSIIVSIFLLLFPFLPRYGNNQSFWAFLSPDFINILKAQRLGLLESFLENLFNPTLITGLGSNRLTVWNFIVTVWNLPFYMGQIIGDVYWLALILYYGYLGLFIFIMFLGILYYKLNKLFKTSSHIQKEIVNCSKILLLLLIPLNFFNQAFEVRTFSFYLWAILALALSHEEKRRNNFENPTNK